MDTFTDTKVSEIRRARIDEWKASKSGKGILEFDADSLIGMYCMDNSLTIAVGATGIPNDSKFLTYLLPGESDDFETTDLKRIRILFVAESIPAHEIRYFCPSFDITD